MESWEDGITCGAVADGVRADGRCALVSMGCAFDPLDVLAADASGAVDGLDEHASSMSATAAIETAPVIDLVMVVVFMIFSPS